jgi:cytidylate kinase
MYQKTASDHFAEAITRLSKQPHPFSRTEAEDPSPLRGASSSSPSSRTFCVAFSREAGSGGITVANEVGRRLNWPVFDQQIMEKLAQDLKVDVTLVEDYDERRGSWLVDTIKAFSASGSVSEVAYFHRLVRMLQALGARGECVVVGRGSMYVLPLDTTLRVRIVASREDRIAFIARERQLTRAEAARFVDTKDRDRLKFIKDHFHKDPADPLTYDLIVNRSRFSVDETAELVIEALQRMQARKLTEKSR